jgi:small GTP-binding protein
MVRGKTLSHDTPGHIDFSAEMERAICAMDYAIVILSGTDGVQGEYRSIWKLLSFYQVPTFFFINKMDQITAIFQRLFTDQGTG